MIIVSLFILVIPFIDIKNISSVFAEENDQTKLGEIVFQDFEDDSLFDIYPSENGSGTITTKDGLNKGKALKYVNESSENPEESGVFIKNKTSIDTTNYKYIAFWIKDSGSNGAGIEIKDSKGNGTSMNWVTSPDSIAGQWTQMFMPLEDFPNTIDWTDVNEIMIAEYWANDYYIDHISFTNVLESDLTVVPSLESGKYEKPMTLQLSSANDAKIYYSIDGSVPTQESHQYKGEIDIDKSINLKIVAEKDGVLSQVQTFGYEVIGKKDDDGSNSEFDNNGGQIPESAVKATKIFTDFENTDDLELVDTDRASGEFTASEFYHGGKSLQYSVSDSGSPEVESGSMLLKKVQPVDASKYHYLSFWIKDTQGSNGIKVGLIDSEGNETDFGHGAWQDGAIKNTWVPISLPISDYNTINLEKLTGIRFGEWNSGTYYIDDIQLTQFSIQALTVSASVPSGSYTEEKLVELSSELGERIYYTTDGSTPNSESSQYSEAIRINKNTIVKTVAEKDGVLGPTSTYSYTINSFKIANEDATWLQTFDHGGDMFVPSPTGTEAAIITDEDRKSDVLSYKVTESGSPETHDGSIEIKANKAVDVSQLKYVIFYIKDTQGDNNLKVSLIDNHGNETDFGAAGWREGLTTKKNEWKQYYVPIDSLTGDVDLSAISGIRIGQWNAGTYLIDSVYFDNYLVTGEPTIVPNAPLASLPDGYRFKEMVEVQLANRSGDAIYYTLDGTEPTMGSYLYTEPISITETTTLKAISFARHSYSKVANFDYLKDATVLEDVTANKSPGEYDKPFEVQLSAEKGATIHYTTDGTTPTENSKTYDQAISITTSTEIRAVAIKDGQSSNVGHFKYKLYDKLSAPTFSVESDDHFESFLLELISSPNVDIYYTLDGTEPTNSSMKYEEPLSIKKSTLIRAVAIKNGISSEISEKQYKIIPKGVNADKPAGNYTQQVVVEFRGEVDNLEIFYTTDGTDPTENGYEETETAQFYTGPLQVNEDTDFKVVARYPGSTYFSDMQIFKYNIKEEKKVQIPRISPNGGTYGSRQTVSMETDNDNATIYYTLDGTEPTNKSIKYEEPFTITKDTVIKAVAVKGNDVSDVASNKYHLTHQISPFLRTDGKVMRNNYGAGQVVQLKGVNVGGWLVMEDWQSPTNAHDQITMLKVLGERFGNDKAWELVNQFQDTWFTEKDFDILKAEGVNVLRLPVTYFEMANDDGSLKDKGRERLEWFLREAEKREIYVLIDLHGAFGSQNGNDHSGDTSNPGVGNFFGNEDNIKKTIRLWKEIAKVAKDNPWVAGYDLLNEPGGALGTEQFEVYDRLYNAVREIDSDHIIHLQAIWEPMHLPNPEFYNWENVVYQYHFYGWDDLNNLDYQKQFINSKVTMVNEYTNYNVPLFVGEFTFFTNIDSWEYGLSTFDQQGWSYTSWTYKVSGEDSSWGMYTAPKTANEVADIYQDDFETIKEKWSVTTETGFTRNTPIADVLSAHFKGQTMVDNEPPIIEGKNAEVEVKTTVPVAEIIDLYIKDNVDGVIYPERDRESSQTNQKLGEVIISEFDPNSLGEQVIKVTATDSSGNMSETKDFIVMVVAEDHSNGDGSQNDDDSEDKPDENNQEEDNDQGDDNKIDNENASDNEEEESQVGKNGSDEGDRGSKGKLPQTGEKSTTILIVIGLSLITLSGVIVFLKNRKNQSKQ